MPYQTPSWAQESPRANQLAAQAALASYDPNSAPKSGSWLLNTIKEAANPALKDAIPKIGGLVGDWWNNKGSGKGQNTDTSETDKYFDKLLDPGAYTAKTDKVKDGIKSLNWYNFGGLL